MSSTPSTSSLPADVTPGPCSSSLAFPAPLSFQLSPSSSRRKAPPSFPSRPVAASSIGSMASALLRPHSARPAHQLDELTLHPSTPTILSAHSPTRQGHSRTRSTGQATPTTRQVYSSAVPSARDESPPSDRARETIPKSFVRQKLRELAPHFYQNVSNADCTILLRLPSTADSPLTPPQSATHNKQTRSSASNLIEIAVMTYKLHQEYLGSQSALFRRFFSSALTPATATSPPPPTPGRSRARLVPSMSKQSHPCLLLDLPDTTSFNLILHWMYWGEFGVIERALIAKTVDWKDLFSTIDILGCDNALKIHCSRFWRKWIKPTNGPSVASLAAAAANVDSPPSSASSGASTVVASSQTLAIPTTSGWPKTTFATSVSDEEEEEEEEDQDERIGRATTAGRMDEDEAFQSFQARVGQLQSDEIEVRLASELGALGQPPPAQK